MRLNEHNQTLMNENKVERSGKAAWINLDSNIHTVRSLAQQSYNSKKKKKSAGFYVTISVDSYEQR